MSVLIKGMEMPTSCYDCNCFIRDSDGSDYCCLLMQDIEDNNKRDDDCPLVEIPPHGRLIDADALIKDGWTLRKEVIRMGGYATHELPLNNPSIPTIIESTIGQLNSDSAVNEANANTSNAFNALDCVEESEASR